MSESPRFCEARFMSYLSYLHSTEIALQIAFCVEKR